MRHPTLRECVLWCLHPWLGRDGKPSRTMLVISVVVGSYLAGRPVPELLGIVAIVATFGLKALMAWISTSRTTLSTSASVAVGARSAVVSATTQTSAKGSAAPPARPPADEDLPG